MPWADVRGSHGHSKAGIAVRRWYVLSGWCALLDDRSAARSWRVLLYACLVIERGGHGLSRACIAAHS
eukprot:11821383-Alexandrium_andersonii.AAC.1